MNSLEKYINSKEFQIIALYSGLRGEKFDKFIEQEVKGIHQMKEKLKSVRYMEKIKLSKQIDLREQKLEIGNYEIVNLEGELHTTTNLIKKLTVDGNAQDEFIKLKALLKNAKKITVASPCIPIYRDAITLISQEKQTIEGIIFICFDCLGMKNEKGQFLEADYETYEQINKYFEIESLAR